MEDHDRRDTDQNAATRLTGLSAQQLIVQLVGGLILAAVVGLVSGVLSARATQQVMSQQLSTMSRQIDEIRGDLQRMRQDLYAPRYRSNGIVGARHASPLPPVVGGPPPGRMAGGQIRGGGAAPTVISHYWGEACLAPTSPLHATTDPVGACMGEACLAPTSPLPPGRP